LEWSFINQLILFYSASAVRSSGLMGSIIYCSSITSPSLTVFTAIVPVSGSIPFAR